MGASKTILLAEDDPCDADMVLTAMEEYHLRDEVAVACDGEEALNYLYRRGAFEHLPQVNPAVVLLDLKMPKVDGLEVLRQIKEDKRLKMIPVVMVTSSAEERDLARSYELGANAYVVKSVGFRQFIDAIKDVARFWAFTNQPPPGSVRVVRPPLETAERP